MIPPLGQTQDGLQQEDDIMEVGPHTFPRDWLHAQSACRLKLVSSLPMTAREIRRPDVYSESDALRALLRRRGPCASKRAAGLAGFSKVFRMRQFIFNGICQDCMFIHVRFHEAYGVLLCSPSVFRQAALTGRIV